MPLFTALAAMFVSRRVDEFLGPAETTTAAGQKSHSIEPWWVAHEDWARTGPAGLARLSVASCSRRLWSTRDAWHWCTGALVCASMQHAACSTQHAALTGVHCIRLRR